MRNKVCKREPQPEEGVFHRGTLTLLRHTRLQCRREISYSFLASFGHLVLRFSQSDLLCNSPVCHSGLLTLLLTQANRSPLPSLSVTAS